MKKIKLGKMSRKSTILPYFPWLVWRQIVPRLKRMRILRVYYLFGIQIVDLS